MFDKFKNRKKSYVVDLVLIYLLQYSVYHGLKVFIDDKLCKTDICRSKYLLSIRFFCTENSIFGHHCNKKFIKRK